MKVDRCVCHEISFSEIKKISEEQDLHSIEELRDERICSTNCKMCEPYIREMLQTGETTFQHKAFIKY